jgi:hypothetical protein
LDAQMAGRAIFCGQAQLQAVPHGGHRTTPRRRDALSAGSRPSWTAAALSSSWPWAAALGRAPEYKAKPQGSGLRTQDAVWPGANVPRTWMREKNSARLNPQPTPKCRN